MDRVGLGPSKGTQNNCGWPRCDYCKNPPIPGPTAYTAAHSPIEITTRRSICVEELIISRLHFVRVGQVNVRFQKLSFVAPLDHDHLVRELEPAMACQSVASVTN
jgi:hypothetical protein